MGHSGIASRLGGRKGHHRNPTAPLQHLPKYIDFPRSAPTIDISLPAQHKMRTICTNYRRPFRIRSMAAKGFILEQNTSRVQLRALNAQHRTHTDRDSPSNIGVRVKGPMRITRNVLVPWCSRCPTTPMPDNVRPQNTDGVHSASCLTVLRCAHSFFDFIYDLPGITACHVRRRDTTQATPNDRPTVMLSPDTNATDTSDSQRVARAQTSSILGECDCPRVHFYYI